VLDSSEASGVPPQTVAAAVSGADQPTHEGRRVAAMSLQLLVSEAAE
jgi:hypothetical protein